MKGAAPRLESLLREDPLVMVRDGCQDDHGTLIWQRRGPYVARRRGGRRHAYGDGVIRAALRRRDVCAG